jgi:hypothetical protein
MSIVAPPGPPVDLQVGAYVSEEWLITATFPAATPAGTFINATASRVAGGGALASIQAPGAEIWHIEQIYYVGAIPSPDVQLVVIVNNNPQPLTLLASSVVLTNFRAPGLLYSWRLQKSSVVTFQQSNIAVVGGLPISVTFRLKVGRFKVAAE